MCLQGSFGIIRGAEGSGWREMADFAPEAAKNRVQPKREPAGQNSANGYGRKDAFNDLRFQRRLAAKA